MRFGDEGLAHILMQLAARARKSRKRKEYLRTVARLAREDTDGRDFLFLCGHTAYHHLHKRNKTE